MCGRGSEVSSKQRLMISHQESGAFRDLWLKETSYVKGHLAESQDFSQGAPGKAFAPVRPLF